MAQTPNTQDILAAARKRNEERLTAIERLVGPGGTRAGIEEAEHDLAEAIRQHKKNLARVRAEDAKAYSDALKAGWTEAELKDVGILAPGAKPARSRSSSSRPRARAAKPATPPAEESHGDVEAQVNDAFSEQLEHAMQGQETQPA